MHLIEVDDFGLQAAETLFALAADGLGSVVLGDVALVVPKKNAFCEDEWARTVPGPQSLRDDFFGMSDAVDRSSINPIYPSSRER